MLRSIKAVTHNGTFHADDVISTVILTEVYGEDIEIIRSRDPEIIEKCDIVYDVGGVYDPDKNRFDHHMQPVPVDENDNILSSAGMLWKAFGPKLVSSEKVRQKIYEKFIKSIDLIDNGAAEFDSVHMPFSYIIFEFNPSWDDNIDPDKAFWKAVEYASQCLLLLIEKEQSRIRANQYLFDLVIEDKVLVMDKSCPWIDWMFDNDIDIDYAIFPGSNNDWMIQCVPVKKDSFELKKPFPEEWAGKRGDDFIDIVGIRDLNFCHPARFIAGTFTKQAALDLIKSVDI